MKQASMSHETKRGHSHTLTILRRSLLAWAGLWGVAVSPAMLQGGEIHDAARDGDLVKVKGLLEADPSLLNAKDPKDWTPLHFAALNNQAPVAQWLVEQGADLSARTKTGDSPLHCAVMGANLLHKQAIVELFLAKGADANARNTAGQTPLFFADQKSLELLLAAKADVNAKSDDGRTRLHQEVHNGNKKIVEYLLSRNADAAVEDKEGLTPIDLATMNVKADLAALLRRQVLKAAAFGEDKNVSLRYKFAPGDSFKFQVLRDFLILTSNPAAPRQEILADQRLRVAVVSPGEAFRLSNVIESMRMRVKPGNFEFDTDNPQHRRGVPKGSPFEAMLAVLDIPIYLDMKPTGEVVSYDLGPFKDKLREINRLDYLDSAKDTSEKLAEGVLVVLPEKPVSRGDHWTFTATDRLAGMGRLKTDYTLTFEGVIKAGGERRAWLSVAAEAKLLPDPDVKETLTMTKFAHTGDVLFSLDRGRLVSARQGAVTSLEISGDPVRRVTVVLYVKIGEIK